MNPVIEMEMERLDSEIEKTRKQFYGAVLRKKRRVKRKWLEISSLTNAHLLQMLPYRAMLSHVGKLAEERDKIIEEILAAKENHSSGSDEDDEEEETIAQDYSVEASSSSIEQTQEIETIQTARDEAVQTEESSFGDKR